MNRYEKACREWLRGCSCADTSTPEECEECTSAFLQKIKSLKADEKFIQYFKCPSCGGAMNERIGHNNDTSIVECECGYRDEINWRNPLTIQKPKRAFYAGLTPTAT